MARRSEANIKELDKAIWAVMEAEELSNQKDFLDRLHQMGVEINQSTLSRHLKKLGIRKNDGVYRANTQGQINANLAVDCIASPPNFLLVKTLPGHANAVGYYLEAHRIKGVAGTVAGNDTLMVALSLPERLEEVQREIGRLFKIDIEET